MPDPLRSLPSSLWRRALCFALVACPLVAVAAQPLATVTIIDGSPATLIRDSAKLLLTEGVRLQKDDLVETGAQVKVLRLEFANGLVADLGPDTRVMLTPKLGGDRSKSNPSLYLLQGWAKLSAPKTPLGSLLLSSRSLDVSAVTGQVVLTVSPTEALLFVEAGTVSLVERVGDKPRPAATLKGDQFFERTGAAKSSVVSRPPPAFIKRLPRPFLDTLPRRAATFASRDPAAKSAGDFSYADAAPWIDSETALRSVFVPRWRALVQQAEFKRGLAANMKSHPEWDRIVFPEKYLPKRPAGDTSPAASPAPSARR
ncbi:MAG: hypothetical protein RLZZ618_2861 [Pseudomonadota bacterium]